MNHLRQKWVSGSIMVSMVVSAFVPSLTTAAIKTPTDKFVRTANYFLKAGTDITPSMYPELARYDLLIFPAEAQVYNRAMFAELRRLNPTIVVLAYVPSKSWNFSWSDPLHLKLRAGIQESWWLRDASGGPVSVWPGTQVVSTVSGWQDYLPQFVHDEIWSTKLWDGVFYDEFSVTASWMNGGNIDIHRDGVRDDRALVDAAWERATISLLKKTRDLVGKDAIIITNGDSTPSAQASVNGRMFETFPTPWEAGGTWSGVMSNYVGLHKQVGHDPVFVINGTTGNSGNNTDYRNVRYTLASTLMADGFFSFDFGDANHGQLWRYDEEDARLGTPIGSAMHVASPADRRLRPGVWRRNYQNGIALVNASGTTQTVTLEGEYEKLRGTQDPRVNDGSVVTSVTIPPDDGLLLLRRIEQVSGASYPNGAFVRLFDMAGTRTRNGFFAFDDAGDGAATVMATELARNSAKSTILAANGRIRILDASRKEVRSFAPYGDAYKGPINLAIGDLDGDGNAEIVTGAGPGGGPQVRIFNKDGKIVHAGWFAYDKNFRGGVSVAIGDLYGTGRPAIITGAGAGGGSHVRIFSRTGRALHPGWFAYATAFKGGVNVAAGDLDGDGMAEIITGPGKGSEPRVKVFSRTGAAIGKGFIAGDPASRSGLRVGATDTDGDGKAEIATYSTEVF